MKASSQQVLPVAVIVHAQRQQAGVLDRPLIFRAQVVAVKRDPACIDAPGQFNRLGRIGFAAGRAANSRKAHSFCGQPFLQAIRSRAERKLHVATGTLPRLGQSQAAHDMTGTDAVGGIGTNQQALTGGSQIGLTIGVFPVKWQERSGIGHREASQKSVAEAGSVNSRSAGKTSLAACWCRVRCIGSIRWWAGLVWTKG
jgi:hypothetical protein